MKVVEKRYRPNYFFKEIVVCCGEEVEPSSHVFLSDPPQREFKCPKCGSIMNLNANNYSGSWNMTPIEEEEDLEICKRIAEIEGIDYYEEDNPFYGHQTFVKQKVCGLPPLVYNPITDKALCADLMDKYKVDMEWNGHDWGAFIPVNLNDIHDQNPQRAICLAIIAANEKKNK